MPIAFPCVYCLFITMGKVSVFEKEAEKMYVEEELPLKEISNQLPVSPHTLTNWKKKFNWTKKRKERRRSIQALPARLLKLAEVLITKIENDLENGVEIPPAKFYAMTKLLDSLPKAEKAEKTKDEQKKDKQGKPLTSANKLEKVKEALFDPEN